MKKIILLLFIYGNVLAEDDPCGELITLTAGQSTTEYSWLFNDFSSHIEHPNQAVNHGGNCVFGIEIKNRDSIIEDRAYYTKTHNDQEQINFRFILDTENLLQSFVPGDTMVFYNFTYKNASNIDKLFMKVRLTKKDYDAANPNINQWEFKIQWKDTVNGGSVHQQYLFSDADQFVEFEFFWKKLTSTNASYAPLFTESQAGVILRSGDGENDTPTVMLSPFNYNSGEHAFINGLIGTSSLGYVNPSDNPAVLGDEIRIVSPKFYD